MEYNPKLSSPAYAVSLLGFLREYFACPDEHLVVIELVKIECQGENKQRPLFHILLDRVRHSWVGGTYDQGEEGRPAGSVRITTMGPQAQVSVGQLRKLYKLLEELAPEDMTRRLRISQSGNLQLLLGGTLFEEFTPVED